MGAGIRKIGTQSLGQQLSEEASAWPRKTIPLETVGTAVTSK